MSDELTHEEIAQALKIAGELIDAGIPVFAAAPDSSRPGQYHLPKAWEQTRPDRAALERWRPGWALGAVGGATADFLDIDPRNGGRESEKEIRTQGQFPRSFGQQGTPSGGSHHIISPTGERKTTNFMPGLDLQSGGRPDEYGKAGRGFVYISPTVRPSKAPETIGELRPYRWVEAPDMELMNDFAGSDDSTEGIIARVYSKRSAPSPLASTQEQYEDPIDQRLFGGGGGYVGTDHSFTVESAKAWVQPALDDLSRAKVGDIENECNRAAVVLSHFVPEFLTPDDALLLLRQSLAHTAYDESHPASQWTVEKFRAVLDGRRPVADAWKAQRTTAPTLKSELTAPPAGGRLRKALLKRSAIHALPDPVPLIEDVLYRNSVAVLSGKFGTYKSFVAISWAASLATGREWFGHEVPNAVPVIYAAAEGAYGLKRRIDAWEKAYGVTVPDTLYLIPLSVRLNRPEDMRELEEIIVETGAQVLVFDTLHASTPGVDENDAGEMGNVMDVLRGLQERHGLCSILPHHTGHAGERARGSSSVEDDADTTFVIRLDGEDRGPDSKRTMVHRKTKDGALLPDVELKLTLVEGAGSGYVAAPDAMESASRGSREGAAQPEDWELKWAEAQRHILRVLVDQGGSIGLTKSEVRQAVADRWYGGVRGRDKGLRDSTFKTAWTRTLELLTPGDGEPVVINPHGEKWAVDPEALKLHSARITGE